MRMLSRFVAPLLISLASATALAAPQDDAIALLERWSAAYSSNDPEAVVQLYASDAILLGTVSPVISEGTEAIRKYFSRLKDSGNKNRIEEKRVIVLGDDAVLVTGFYEFSGPQEGKIVARPSRFTMLMLRRGGEWHIAHHHSSPHVQPSK